MSIPWFKDIREKLSNQKHGQLVDAVFVIHVRAPVATAASRQRLGRPGDQAGTVS
jgi:hypothetical protein